MQKTDPWEHFRDNLREILEKYKGLKGQSRYSDLSDLEDSDIQYVITKARAAVERITARQSAYSRQTQEILARVDIFDGTKTDIIIGVV